MDVDVAFIASRWHSDEALGKAEYGYGLDLGSGTPLTTSAHICCPTVTCGVHLPHRRIHGVRYKLKDIELNCLSGCCGNLLLGKAFLMMVAFENGLLCIACLFAVQYSQTYL